MLPKFSARKGWLLTPGWGGVALPREELIYPGVLFMSEAEMEQEIGSINSDDNEELRHLGEAQSRATDPLL